MKSRDMSDFMTKELLYDYEKNLLDPERRASVLEVLQKSEDVQKDLKVIQSGVQYLNHLSETQVSVALLEQVKQRITYFGQLKLMMSYENWPPFVKWTMEAVLVISVVIIVSLIAPWGRFKDFVMQSKDSELILAELPKSSTTPSPEALNKMEKVDKGSFDDEGGPVAAAPVPHPEPAEALPKPAPAAKAPVVAATVSQKVEDSKRKGFVFRGVLSIVNAEVGTAKLKEKIVELGGRKAGEVELGWRRNQGDYYFHFTVPESKLEALQEYFKTLGNIKLSKDPHPRVMPDGIVRMIITTEESK